MADDRERMEISASDVGEVPADLIGEDQSVLWEKVTGSPLTNPYREVSVEIVKQVPHPDFGMLEPGDVIRTQLQWANEFEKMGVGERVTKEPTREPSVPHCRDCGSTNVALS